MNGALFEAFRHDAWANKQLLEFCRDLSREELTAQGTGTYAGILGTFHHIVMADARYLRRLAGSAPPWVDSEGGSDPGDVDPESVDIDQLHSRVEETEKLWEELWSEPFDAERLIILDLGAYQAHAGLLRPIWIPIGRVVRLRQLSRRRSQSSNSAGVRTPWSSTAV